ncbi:WD40 repeat domain-containing serine/threonine protein kinase [Pseudonocardia sp. TRM90224]|uniref:WD40 repeat domain-containing serine/threonine protein kinase n=1 Tax=Pseudonocardia sp. TRM90224 TaxID=2812678 RepID=UPI001E5F33F4|nr:WD40 repeat domain-containing serine/threonine-protein kinase [Pseudonocardia sp. TRM90224]
MAAQFGSYALEGLIGRGGMGEVHRAVDTAHDGRVVALKLLPRDVSDDPELRARFRYEAETVARLGEPHVIPVHGYGEINGRLFIDMQLVDGPDLSAFLIATGALRAEIAVGIVEQVAAALDAAHAAGLVHHDVKPSNVLVHRPEPGRVPHVVLADFGIAGDAAGLGTVEYLAPERIRGQRGDHRVDVYALACVLFEMLTGARTFAGAELAAQVYGHLHRPPTRPSSIVAALPPELDAVVMRGLAKDPDQRPASAGAFAAEARAALAPVAGGGLSRRRVLIAAAVGAATLGGGLAVSTAVRGRAPWQPTGGPDVSPSGAGSPPQPVVEERVLGIRTTETDPFVLGAVGQTIVGIIATGDTFQAWDLRADTRIGPQLPAGVEQHAPAGVDSLALADVDGIPIMCSTLFEATEIVFTDLRTGLPSGAPVRPASAPISKLTSAVIDGAPVVVAVHRDGKVSRHDVRTRQPLGPPVEIADISTLFPPDVAYLGDRPCLVIQPGLKVTERAVWDARTMQEISTYSGLESTLAELDGTPVMVGAYGAIFVRDLATGEQRRQIPAPAATIGAVAVVDGRLLVAAGEDTGEVWLYDVAAGTRIGSPMRGHEAELRAMGVVQLGDRPVLVTASKDNSVRVWDVAVHAYGG